MLRTPPGGMIYDAFHRVSCSSCSVREYSFSWLRIIAPPRERDTETFLSVDFLPSSTPRSFLPSLSLLFFSPLPFPCLISLWFSISRCSFSSSRRSNSDGNAEHHEARENREGNLSATRLRRCANKQRNLSSRSVKNRS